MVLKIWFLNSLRTSVYISHSYTLYIIHQTLYIIQLKKEFEKYTRIFLKFKLKSSFYQSLTKTFENFLVIHDVTIHIISLIKTCNFIPQGMTR